MTLMTIYELDMILNDILDYQTTLKWLKYCLQALVGKMDSQTDQEKRDNNYEDNRIMNCGTPD